MAGSQSGLLDPGRHAWRRSSSVGIAWVLALAGTTEDGPGGRLSKGRVS